MPGAQNPADERDPRSPSVAIADSPASGQLTEVSATDTVTPEAHMAVAPEPVAQSAQPSLTAVQLALHAGWIMAVLYGKIPALPAESLQELPGTQELPPAERRELELNRLRHLLQRLASLPGFTGSGMPTGIPANDVNEAAPQDTLRELNLAILTALAATHPEIQLAYELGLALRDTVNPPEYAMGPQTPRASLAKQLARGRIAKLQEWLAILSSQFPPHAAGIVAASLGRWSDLAAVTVNTSMTRLKRSYSADVATKMREYLLPQGDLWLMALTGAHSISGLLSPDGYVTAGEVALRRSAKIVRRVFQHYWAALLILAAALAGTVYLALSSLGGAARVWTAIAAIGGSLGISAKTITSTSSRLASEAERPVFAVAEEDAMAWAITTLPPLRLTPRRVQWLKRGPRRAGDGRVSRTKVSRGKERSQSTQSSSWRTRQIGSYLIDLLRSAPYGGRSLARRAIAAGVACVVAAGSGVAAVLTGVTASVSLVVSLGVLVATVVTLETAVTVSERQSHAHSRKQAADSWGQATDGGTAEEVRVRAHPSGGGGPSGPPEESAAGGGDSQARQRYLKGQCPERIPVGKPFSLLASIVLEGPASAKVKHFNVPPQGRDVLLVVHAPGLRLLGDQRLTVRVPPDGDSEPVMFELRADAPGPRSVSITAWLDGSYLGELVVEITAERGRPPGPHRDAFAEITTESTEGAVSLVVRYDPIQNAYRFEFRDEDNPGEVTSNLAYDPRPLVEQLVRGLDDLAKGRTGYSADEARDYLVNRGAELWDELVPMPLREQFWDRQHRIRQLTILADQDVVPWELLYPLDPGHDEGFLVEQFPLTRAIFGRPPARRLNLRPARFVLPEGSLPEAREEIDTMRQLLDPQQPPEAVVSALTPLQDLIRSGDFGLLHFACHNRFDPTDGSAITLDNRKFAPTLMKTAAINKVLAKSAPTVFMNACRSAGTNATYNRLDGWASKFLEAGAAAFIGSLWAVSDGTAREFAQELYKQLQAGSSLGEAVMQARHVAASQPDDPTWLAYTVYGDPRATVSQRP